MNSALSKLHQHYTSPTVKTLRYQGYTCPTVMTLRYQCYTSPTVMTLRYQGVQHHRIGNYHLMVGGYEYSDNSGSLAFPNFQTIRNKK